MAWSSMPLVVHSRFIPNRVEVNAAICKRAEWEISFKRSAFDFPLCNKLCRWRHLLQLGVGIMRECTTGGILLFSTNIIIYIS